MDDTNETNGGMKLEETEESRENPLHTVFIHDKEQADVVIYPSGLLHKDARATTRPVAK